MLGNGRGVVGWLGLMRLYYIILNLILLFDVEVVDGCYVKVLDGVRKLVILVGWEREEIKISYLC